MIYTGLLTVSLFFLRNLKVNFNPTMESRKIQVETEFNNADASTIREMVTIALENALTTLHNHKTISSISKDGISIVQIEFNYGNDMELSLLKTREIVDSVFNQLPYGCNKSKVTKIERSEEFFVFAVNAKNNANPYTKNFVERFLLNDLLRIKGVTNVLIYGGDTEEIHIYLDSEKIVQRKLTIDDVAKSCNLSNCEYPIGTINDGLNLIQVKVNGRLNTIEELENIIIQHDSTRGTVRLKDVGIIKKELQRRKSFATIDGNDTLLVYVKFSDDENPLKTSKKIRRLLSHYNEIKCGYLSFETINDSSSFLLDEIIKLILQGSAGICITFICLWIFFRTAVLAFAVSISIPICIIFTLAILNITGNTLNSVTLSGLTLGIGLIIDCSAIVTEKIIHSENIVKSSHKIKLSNIGATVTTVLAFTPVFFIGGPIKDFFSGLSIVIISCVIFSYLVSCSITISILTIIASKRKLHDVNVSCLNKKYGLYLKKSFDKSYLVIASIIIFIGAGIVGFKRMNYEFNSITHTNCATLYYNFPENITINYMQSKANEIFKTLKQIPCINKITMIGGEEKDTTEFSINSLYKNMLKIELHFNKIKIADLKNIFHEANLDSVFKINYSANRFKGFYDYPLNAFYIKDNSVEKLNACKKRLEEKMKVNFVPDENKYEFEFHPSIEKLSKLSVSQDYISNCINEYIEGVKINSVIEDDTEKDCHIYIQNKEENIMNVLNTMYIFSGNTPVPIISLGEITKVKKENVFYRENRKDVKIIETNDFDCFKLNEEISDRRVEDKNQFSKDFFYITILICLLIYFFIGMLFDSYSIPFYVCLTMVLSIPGSIIFLLVFGYSLDYNTVISWIILIGLSANNSILLFESILQNAKLNEGNIIESSTKVLGAIFITNSTTIFSIIPFVFSSSISVSIIGGLLCSIPFHLFIIPLIVKKGITK